MKKFWQRKLHRGPWGLSPIHLFEKKILRLISDYYQMLAALGLDSEADQPKTLQLRWSRTLTFLARAVSCNQCDVYVRSRRYPSLALAAQRELMNLVRTLKIDVTVWNELGLADLPPGTLIFDCDT